MYMFFPQTDKSGHAPRDVLQAETVGEYCGLYCIMFDVTANYTHRYRQCDITKLKCSPKA